MNEVSEADLTKSTSARETLVRISFRGPGLHNKRLLAVSWMTNDLSLSLTLLLNSTSTARLKNGGVPVEDDDEPAGGEVDAWKRRDGSEVVVVGYTWMGDDEMLLMSSLGELVPTMKFVDVFVDDAEVVVEVGVLLSDGIPTLSLDRIKSSSSEDSMTIASYSMSTRLDINPTRTTTTTTTNHQSLFSSYSFDEIEQTILSDIKYLLCAVVVVVLFFFAKTTVLYVLKSRRKEGRKEVTT